MKPSSQSNSIKFRRGWKVLPLVLLLITCACTAQPVMPNPLPATLAALETENAGLQAQLSQTQAPPAPSRTPAAMALPSLTATDTTLPSMTPTDMPAASPAATDTAISSTAPSGPWLVYDSSGSNKVSTTPLRIINQDGSGLTTIDVNLGGEEAFADPTNQLVAWGNVRYIVRPGSKIGFLISGFSEKLMSDELVVWNLAFAGDTRTGLLAYVAGSAAETGTPASPELFIFKVPSLAVAARFPLVVCPDGNHQCFNDILAHSPSNGSNRSPIGDMHQVAWSPDKRTLAYAAFGSDSSSNLYVYDTGTGKSRQLTSEPDDIGQIWWSPDGKWILFETLSGSGYSMWEASPSSATVRQFFTVPTMDFGLGVWTWSTNDLALTYEGFVQDYYLPRLVTMGTGKATELVQDPSTDIRYMGFNPHTGVFIYDSDAWYWETVSDPTPREMANQNANYAWDPALQQFTYDDYSSSSSCPKGKRAVWTPDSVQCIAKLMPTATPTPAKTVVYASPNSRWQVKIAGGVWLQNASGAAVGQVGSAVNGQIIWRPDSKGFFLAEMPAQLQDRQAQKMYYVSVPDLSMTLVDDNIAPWGIVYQWLGVNGQ
jgi:hypothetical protein